MSCQLERDSQRPNFAVKARTKCLPAADLSLVYAPEFVERDGVI